MNLKKTIMMCLPLLWLGSVATAQAQDETEAFTPTYKYRVALKDKKGTPFSLRHPEAFLSEKAIERRKRQHLKLDETDLPQTPAYLQQVEQTGVKIVNRSKWMNTLVVETPDTALLEQVAALPFVVSVEKVAQYTKPRKQSKVDRFSLIKKAETPKLDAEALDTLATEPELVLGRVIKTTQHNRFRITDDTLSREELVEQTELVGSDDETLQRVAEMYKEMTKNEKGGDVFKHPVYGYSYNQLNINHAQALHEQGFRGEGMTIAIIDGGFYNADIIPRLSHVKVLGTKDFVEPGGNVYEKQNHGMMVLTCIAANTKGELMGTAPEASFWLLRSEDGDSEQPVEEDNWCAAIEFADSVGADLVNTSLGYTNYDAPFESIKYHLQDGRTYIMSRSASLAAGKGMVLCQSAGNEGDNTWKRIGVPADAPNILTVGALRPDAVNTDFSSLGFAADGRVKPDVCAQGQQCALLASNGEISYAAGTSFSSPIMCGMVACFWQKNPHLSAFEVIDAVRALGDRYENPDNVYGYGAPDFSK